MADFETDVALESSVSFSAAMNKKKRRHRKKKQKQPAVCGEPDALFSDSEEATSVRIQKGIRSSNSMVRRAGGRRQGDGVRARGREQLGLARYQRSYVQEGGTRLRQTLARIQQMAPCWQQSS